jgi:hypothetical protein
MKIDDYNQIASISSGALLNKEPVKTGDTSFGEYLNKKILQAENIDSASASSAAEELVSPVDGLSESGAISKVMPPITKLTDDSAISILDALLSALEKYESALADPGVSLKKIDPLVKSMQEQADQMESALKANEVDESLQSLANLILSQSRVESIKFQRGDYIE